MDLRAATVFLEPSGLDERASRALVSECHQIALAYLNQKARRGALDPRFFGLSIEDLALDCIADLFETDGDGGLPLVNSFFRREGLDARDESGLRIALRRLVFSKVNEGLFRRYREQDPGLARIIRNLKIGVARDPRFCLEKNSADSWICLKDSAESRALLPLMPPEILEAYLIPHIRPEKQFNHTLGTLFDIFSHLTHYRDRYPLSMLARSIRSASGRLVQNEGKEVCAGFPYASEDQLLREYELERIVNDVLASVAEEFRRTYVGNKKVSEKLFTVYLDAIRSGILSTYAVHGEDKSSYLDALRQQFPSMSREQYAERHRNIIEYLGKISKRRFIRHVRSYLSL